MRGFAGCLLLKLTPRVRFLMAYHVYVCCNKCTTASNLGCCDCAFCQSPESFIHLWFSYFRASLYEHQRDFIRNPRTHSGVSAPITRPFTGVLHTCGTSTPIRTWDISSLPLCNPYTAQHQLLFEGIPLDTQSFTSHMLHLPA